MPSISEMVEASKLRYEKGLSQKEIGKLMGTSQSRVSEILREAERNKIVRKTIHVPPELHLGRYIKEAHPHIKECLVISYSGDLNPQSNALLIDELAKEASEHFSRHVQSGSIVGFSCGETLGRMTDKMKVEADIRDLFVYSLSIWCQPEIHAISPVELVSRIIRKYKGSVGYSCQFPGYSEDPKQAEKQKALDLERFQPLWEELESSQKGKVLYVGLGAIPSTLHGQIDVTRGRPTLDFSFLLEKLRIPVSVLSKMAGECCFQPYTISGALLSRSNVTDQDMADALYKLEANTLSFKLDRLQQMVKTGAATVCAVAGGSGKHEAILGAVRAKICNHIILDIGSANYLLDHA